eukprot:gene1521-1914_t
MSTSPIRTSANSGSSTPERPISLSSSTSSTTTPTKKQPGIQLDSDGCLIKRILKEGTGDIPPQKSIVSVHYEGYLSNNIIFDSSVQSNTPFTFQLGSNKVIDALEMAIVTMKVGEEAEIVTTQKFAFGKNGLPPFIPPNTSIIYKIQLLSFTIDNNEYYNFETLIHKSLQEKEKGNEFFKKSIYKKAMKHYIKSIWLLGDSRFILDISESNQKLLKDSLIVLYLNLATCNIKLKQGRNALLNCEKVVEIGGNTAKLYYKMGQAYALNKQYEPAKRSLVQAIRMEPNDKLLRDELENIKKEQELFNNENNSNF